MRSRLTNEHEGIVLWLMDHGFTVKVLPEGVLVYWPNGEIE